MQRKKIGYYISKGKCLKVFAVKKVNNRTNKVQLKKVNSKGKVLRKGTKVYKTKANCEKALRKMKKTKAKRTVRRTKKSKSKARRSPKRRSTRFGQGCAYSVPYFGDMVPSVAKFVSGTPDTGLSSYAWGWPTPPGALRLDRQQGGWLRAKNIVNN